MTRGRGTANLRVMVAALLVALVAAPGCRSVPTLEEQLAVAVQEPALVLQVSPARMREAVDQTYELRPDQRFLAAVPRIHEFLTGEPRGEAIAVSRRGHWVVSYHGREVAQVSHLPSFEEMLGTLRHWAEQLLREHPIRLDRQADDVVAAVQSELDGFMLPHVKAALRRANAAWRDGQTDPRLCHQAAYALATLVLQGVDDLEQADAIYAQALAVLAIGNALAPEDAPRTESLLSLLMGYNSHARSMAARLRESDALRRYIFKDYTGLQSMAAADSASVESRYLLLLQLSDLRRREAWEQLQARYFSHATDRLPLYRAAYAMELMDRSAAVATLMPTAVAESMELETGVKLSVRIAHAQLPALIKAIVNLFSHLLSADAHKLLYRFDLDSRLLGTRYSGPFLDSEAIIAFYRGAFYTALRTQGLYYLDTLSSVEGAKLFADEIGDDRLGPAAEFQRWYHDLADAKSGNARPLNLRQDLFMTSLGVPALLRTYDELMPLTEDRLLVDSSPLRLLIRRMDSRVSHRRALGYRLMALYRLRPSIALYRAVLRDAPVDDLDLVIWYGGYSADYHLLQQVLRYPDLGPERTLTALAQLERAQKLPTSALVSAYEQAHRRFPWRWTVVEAYAGYLGRKGHQAEAIEMLRRFTLRVGPRHENYGAAATALAKLLVARGKLTEALLLLDRGRDGLRAEALALRADVLEKMGRREEAEEQARAANRRYPDNVACLMALARIWWRSGRQGEAASLLAAWPYPLTKESGDLVSQTFIEAMAGRPDAQALAAYIALFKHNYPGDRLHYLAQAVDQAGRHQLAFEMERMQVPREPNNLDLGLYGYRFLRAARGPKPALAWLQGTFRLRESDLMAGLILRAGETDLLWEWVRDEGPPHVRDYTWLVRAAASLDAPRQRADRRQAVAAYFSQPGQRLYHLLGRHLLGLASEQQALAGVQTPAERRTAAYFLGHKAAAECRIPDAASWFAAALETGERDKASDYGRSMDRLALWYRQFISLERIAQNCRRSRAGKDKTGV